MCLGSVGLYDAEKKRAEVSLIIILCGYYIGWRDTIHYGHRLFCRVMALMLSCFRGPTSRFPMDIY